MFFINSFVGGGAEKVCLNLAKQLHKMDIDSDFITVFKKKPDYDIPEYVRIYSLELDESCVTWAMLIRCLPRVNAYIADRKYILITAHLQPSQGLASLSRAGRKCLYVMHATRHLEENSYSWQYKVKLWWFLKGKKVVTVSKGLAQELQEEYGIKSNQITTIYNPCDIHTLKAKKNLKSWNDRRPYILVMGRLEEQKNPLLALELYYRGKFYRDYDLVYLGQGSLESSVRRSARIYDIQQSVFLVGFHNNPEHWLVNASLLLMCSKQEGFSMSIAEALICGTPVVASDCPHGPNEILTGELSGYLIHPEKRFDESVSVISSALNFYPEITEKYYAKFDDRLVTETYLKIWNEYFER